MTYITRSVEETVERGKVFAAELGLDDVVLFYGDMGVGKTHFIKGMALGLGVDAAVTSPTFALVNDYGALKHFDLFRINGVDDLYAIGFYDYIGGGVLAIEWAENVVELSDEFSRYYTVRISKNDVNENIREIEIDSFGT